MEAKDFVWQFKEENKVESHESVIYRIRLPFHCHFKEKFGISTNVIACKVFDDKSIGLREWGLGEKFSSAERGVLKYYSVVKTDQIYIFMEGCWKNNTLFHRIADKQQTNERFLISQLKNLFCGLQHIHDLGYVHSDIAPKNIFIDHYGQFKLADFGSAREKGSPMTQYTDYYISKETYFKINNKQIVYLYEKIDYWALGKSIYEICMCQNNVNFMNYSDFNLVQRIRRDLSSKNYSPLIINIVIKLFQVDTLDLTKLLPKSN